MHLLVETADMRHLEGITPIRRNAVGRLCMTSLLYYYDVY